MRTCARRYAETFTFLLHFSTSPPKTAIVSFLSHWASLFSTAKIQLFWEKCKVFPHDVPDFFSSNLFFLTTHHWENKLFLDFAARKFGSYRKSSYLCITKGNDFLPLKWKSSTVIGLANQFSGFLFPQVLYLSIEHRLINNETGTWYLVSRKEILFFEVFHSVFLRFFNLFIW